MPARLRPTFLTLGGARLVLAGSAALAWQAPTVAQAAPTGPGELVHPLANPQDCAACHLFANPDWHAGEPNISPWAWQGSMMANAARDPVFWAAVDLASQDQVEPDETEDCIRCHAPNAFLEGRGDALSIEELLPIDREGISCDMCHRMVEDPEVDPGNARYTLDDTGVGGAVPKRGPWNYDPGAPAPDHPFLATTELGESRMCGTCHDVTTHRERLDDQGQPTGTLFPEQRTFSEWARSDFALGGAEAQSCQDCHMPAISDAVGCEAFSLSGTTHPEGGRRHELVGANVEMMRILQAQYGSAGTAEVDDAFYELSRERAEVLLGEALSLEVDFPEAINLQVGIPSWSVRVENKSGHKLPTGYSEGRVMWVELEARYEGELLWSSGAWDEATASIQDDPQVRRYEAIAERLSDGTSNHLLLNDHWRLDNRLPPRGLLPHADTDPVGDRYTLLPGGAWPHYDQVDYNFAPLSIVGPTEEVQAELRVRVLYWVNTSDYLELLREEGGAAGSSLGALLDAAGAPQPLVLAESQAVVPLSGFSLDEEGSSESDGSSSLGSEDSGAETSDEGAESESGGATQGTDAGSGGCACRIDRGDSPPRSAGLFSLLLLGRIRRRPPVEHQ